MLAAHRRLMNVGDAGWSAHWISVAVAETPGRLLNLEIHRRCFPAALFDLIFEVLPFIERAQPSALDRGYVDEYVFAACLRLDKSVALRRIEPLHGAARHFDLPSPDPGRCYSDRRLGRQGDRRVVHSCISMPDSGGGCAPLSRRLR